MVQRSKEVWRRTTIEEVRTEIVQEMSRVLAASDEDELLSYLLRRIQALQQESEAPKLLTCFLLIIETLQHQQRYGGLSKKQIQDLSTLAHSILRVAGIRPRHTPSSYLYTELHGVLSGLHSSGGDYWLALWELEMGNYAADLPPLVAAQQQLAMGSNALRLGQRAAAGLFFNRALEAAENPALREAIQLQLLRCQRLSGQPLEARNFTEQLLAQAPESGYRDALLWEKICLEAAETQDLSAMAASIKKGQALHQPTFRLEFFLWAGVHPKTLWLQKVVKVSSTGSLKKMQQQGSFVLFQIAQSLELAYDSQMPFPRRLEEVKKIFPKIKLLAQVEHELLVWLFLARWLYRCHHYPMAKLCFGEYEGLCKKLSGGQSRDLIGLAADLLEIDWLQKAA